MTLYSIPGVHSRFTDAFLGLGESTSLRSKQLFQYRIILALTVGQPTLTLLYV